MPYKDRIEQLAAQRRHYVNNKAVYASRSLIARRERQAYVDALRAGPCTDCKQTFHVCVMQFDHVRGTKVANISKLVKHTSLAGIKLELEKCELVCANCHAVRTWQRAQPEVPPVGVEPTLAAF